MIEVLALKLKNGKVLLSEVEFDNEDLLNSSVIILGSPMEYVEIDEGGYMLTPWFEIADQFKVPIRTSDIMTWSTIEEEIIEKYKEISQRIRFMKVNKKRIDDYLEENNYRISEVDDAKELIDEFLSENMEEVITRKLN